MKRNLCRWPRTEDTLKFGPTHPETKIPPNLLLDNKGPIVGAKYIRTWYYSEERSEADKTWGLGVRVPWAKLLHSAWPILKKRCGEFLLCGFEEWYECVICSQPIMLQDTSGFVDYVLGCAQKRLEWQSPTPRGESWKVIEQSVAKHVRGYGLALDLATNATGDCGLDAVLRGLERHRSQVRCDTAQEVVQLVSRTRTVALRVMILVWQAGLGCQQRTSQEGPATPFKVWSWHWHCPRVDQRRANLAVQHLAWAISSIELAARTVYKIRWLNVWTARLIRDGNRWHLLVRISSSHFRRFMQNKRTS